MYMQVTYSPDHPRRFWIALGGVVTLIALIWMGMTHFDTTLAKAREHLSSAPLVIAKVGAVNGATLYKVRRGDITTGSHPCFAEYFFYVTGQSGGSVNVRVLVCGSHDEPDFKVTER